MSIENRAYFIAAGKSLEQVEAWDKTTRAARKAARAWAKELCATEISFCERGGLEAMQFSGPAPSGWRKCSGRNAAWHAPSWSRSKEAKAVRAKIDSMRPSALPGEQKIATNDAGDGMAIYWPVAQKLGGKWIISQHKDCKTTPADAKPLKRSKYMAMVEAAEQAGAIPV